jgi:hypothetical protein
MLRGGGSIGIGRWRLRIIPLGLRVGIGVLPVGMLWRIVGLWR